MPRDPAIMQKNRDEVASWFMEIMKEQNPKTARWWLFENEYELEYAISLYYCALDRALLEEHQNVLTKEELDWKECILRASKAVPSDEEKTDGERIPSSFPYEGDLLYNKHYPSQIYVDLNGEAKRAYTVTLKIQRLAWGLPFTIPIWNSSLARVYRADNYGRLKSDDLSEFAKVIGSEKVDRECMVQIFGPGAMSMYSH